MEHQSRCGLPGASLPLRRGDALRAGDTWRRDTGATWSLGQRTLSGVWWVHCETALGPPRGVVTSRSPRHAAAPCPGSDTQKA